MFLSEMGRIVGRADFPGGALVESLVPSLHSDGDAGWAADSIKLELRKSLSPETQICESSLVCRRYIARGCWRPPRRESS